jgi:hypothetical protein
VSSSSSSRLYTLVMWDFPLSDFLSGQSTALCPSFPHVKHVITPPRPLPLPLYEELRWRQHNLLADHLATSSAQRISASAVRFHLFQLYPEVSSNPPWASEFFPGQLPCLLAGFCITLAVPSCSSAFPRLLEPSGMHPQLFEWSACSVRPECCTSVHSGILPPSHHRSLDDHLEC